MRWVNVDLSIKYPGRWISGERIALVIGLVLFLREIHLGSRAARIDLDQAAAKPPDAA